MAPNLKRPRKASEAEPDLATLLEPYGTPESQSSEDPADADVSDAPDEDDAS
jgi:hypothetical protein